MWTLRSLQRPLKLTSGCHPESLQIRTQQVLGHRSIHDYQDRQCSKSTEFLNVSPRNIISRKLSTTPVVQKALRGAHEVTVALREEAFALEKDEVRDKKTFLAAVDRFKYANPNYRGHVEFVNTALKHVEEFQVHRDLEVYKTLLDCFPKRKMLPPTLVAATFIHFPRNQDAAIAIMTEMEKWNVLPDRAMRTAIIETFGPDSMVFRKYGRMMFWMPKFKNLTPWPVPDPTPKDPKVLSHLAINRISVDPEAEIQEFDCNDLKESSDKTWIVSSQSPEQRELLEKQVGKQPVYIEGPFNVWLREKVISYFMLSADPQPKPEISINADDVTDMRLTMFGEEPIPSEDLSRLPKVHEQRAYTVFAFCATGTSSRDSLLSWLRFLQRTNPCLQDISVVFKLKAPSNALTVIENDSSKDEKSEEPRE